MRCSLYTARTGWLTLKGKEREAEEQTKLTGLVAACDGTVALESSPFFTAAISKVTVGDVLHRTEGMGMRSLARECL